MKLLIEQEDAQNNAERDLNDQDHGARPSPEFRSRRAHVRQGSRSPNRRRRHA